MKKYFTAIGWTLLYLLIFIVVQTVVTVGATIVILAQHPEVLAAGMEGAIAESTSLMMQYGVYIAGISAAILIPLILLLKPSGVTLKEGFGLRRAGWRNIACTVLVSFGIYLLIGVVMGVIPWPEPWVQQHGMSTDSVIGDSLWINLLFTGLLVPVMEELLFRGGIYGAMKRGMPTAAALLLQAAVFGLMHFNPIQFVYAFFLGLVMGLLLERTRSIWVPVTVHIMMNGGSILLSSVGEERYAQWMEQPYVGIAVLTGCILFAILGIAGLYFFNRPGAKGPGREEYGEFGRLTRI